MEVCVEGCIVCGCSCVDGVFVVCVVCFGAPCSVCGHDVAEYGDVCDVVGHGASVFRGVCVVVGFQGV